MIQLLFTLLAAEVAVVVVLLFKTPLRKLGILSLDRLKRGRGPVMVRTIAGTALVVLSSSLFSMAKIRNRSEGIGSLTPTDQVLMSRHLLEASLMGYSLFLTIIIDRLHHYIRELRTLRKSMETVMKQNRSLEESKTGGSEEIQARDKEISSLNEHIAKLKLELASKSDQAKAAEENNQNLQNQLQSI